MKTQLTITVTFILLLMMNSSFATIRTVSNSPSTTLAQFSTIQAAVDASTNGDTIYVHGSSVGYASFTVSNKGLVIIGPGWNPDKNLTLTASVNTCTFNNNCSNSEIQGMVISGVSVTSALSANMRFIRNRFTSSFNFSAQLTTFSGYLFEGNVFVNTAIIGEGNLNSKYQNIVIRNNYFYSDGGAQIQNFIDPLNTILIDHNLFFGPSGASSVTSFRFCYYTLIISNNIFVKRDAYFGATATNGTYRCTFSNNITFNPGIAPDVSLDSPWLVNENINAGGNISDTDPQMVSQALVNSGSNNPLLDFTIASGPANNAGVDGKDIGLLYDATGSLNWTNSRNSRLPRVYSMIITNPLIQPGGTINVTVEGRKSN